MKYNREEDQRVGPCDGVLGGDDKDNGKGKIKFPQDEKKHMSSIKTLKYLTG